MFVVVVVIVVVVVAVAVAVVVAGCWLLVGGCWLLVVRCSLFVVGCGCSCCWWWWWSYPCLTRTSVVVCGPSRLSGEERYVRAATLGVGGGVEGAGGLGV